MRGKVQKPKEDLEKANQIRKKCAGKDVRNKKEGEIRNEDDQDDPEEIKAIQ